MINSKPNYNIESYQTSDKSREIYCSFRGRTITQTIDDRTFCLCQTIFRCNHSSHEEENCPNHDEPYVHRRAPGCKGDSCAHSVCPCDDICGCMAPND